MDDEGRRGREAAASGGTLWASVAALFGASGVGAWTFGRLDAAATGLSFAAALLGVALVARQHGRTRLLFMRGTEHVGMTGAASLFVPLPLTAVLFGAFSAYHQWRGESAEALRVATFLAAVGTGAWCVVWVALTGRTSARLAGKLLGATPLSPGPGTGRVLGTVHDATPLEDGNAMVVEQSESSVDDRGTPVTAIDLDLEERQGFHVHTSHGDQVRVFPRNMIWATTVRRFYDGEVETVRWNTMERTLERLTREVLPQYASVAVLGRIDADGTLRAAGGDTPLLFATEPGGDPLAPLRRLRAGRWLLLAVLVAVSVAAGAAHVAMTGLPALGTLAA